MMGLFTCAVAFVGTIRADVPIRAGEEDYLIQVQKQKPTASTKESVTAESEGAYEGLDEVVESEGAGSVSSEPAASEPVEEDDRVYEGLEEVKQNAKDACEYGDDVDCEMLAKTYLDSDADNGLEADSEEDVIRKVVGSVPHDVKLHLGLIDNAGLLAAHLDEPQNHSRHMVSLIHLKDGGHLTESGDLVEDAEFFGGLKIHLGPIVIGGDKLFSVEPQMKFGAESDHFQFVAGCDDIRDKLKCHATAELRQICDTSGYSVIQLLQNARCKSSNPFAQKAHEITRDIIASLLQDVGVDVAGNVYLKAKLTMTGGAQIMGGMALGLWSDKDGYKMQGSGMAGLVKSVGYELYTGIHHHGNKAKFVVSMGQANLEVTFDCTHRKKDAAIVRRIQHGHPTTSGPAKKFVPVGYGYGRGAGGAYTNSYCKMYVTFNDCMRQCDRDSQCVGFDAEVKYDKHWQQCCIRTKVAVNVAGWHTGHGPSRSCTQGSGRTRENRLVMAKNQFIRIGSGYGRGKGHVRDISVYCKMYVNYNSCQKQCENDKLCTGFDAEVRYNRHWQQCCIRSLGTGPFPSGWHGTPGRSMPVMVASDAGHHHNRAVMKKVR